MLEFSRKAWRYCLIGCLAVTAALYGIWEQNSRETSSVHISEAAVPAEVSSVTEAIGLETTQTEPRSTAVLPQSVPVAAEPAPVEEKQSAQEMESTAVESMPMIVSEPVLPKAVLAANVPKEEQLQPVPQANTVGTAGQAIVQSLQQKGTPKENYKVSEVDDDIVLDAAAFTSGPGNTRAVQKNGAAAPAKPQQADTGKGSVRK